MVKVESFDLRLDRFDCQYAAGDFLSGSVYLSVTSKHPIKIKDLSVTLIGEGKTSWVNKISDNIYDSTEPYLNTKQTFKNLLDEISGDQGHLPSGQHRFPFRFRLPDTLPSSYEGEFGNIRYTCVAQINVTGGDVQRSASLRAGFSSRNKKIVVEKEFIVSAQVGINQLSPLNETANGLREEGNFESSGCCGIGVGRINAAMYVPCPAFLLGQSMPVEVWIDNHTRRPMHSPAVVTLVHDVYFRSVSFFQTASDCKSVSRVVDAIQVEMPERGKSLTKTVYVTIPHNLPASSLNETLITIRYKLRLEVGHFEIVLPIGLASKG